MKNKKLINIISNLDLLIASAALIALILITSLGVILRYALHTPLLWQEEGQSFCQVWLVFLGGSVVFRMTGHVAIEMLHDSLSERGRRVLDTLIDVIVLFVLVFLAINADSYISQVFGRSGRVSPILRIPLKYMYGIAPYACVIMIVSHFAHRFAPKFVASTNMVEGGKEESA